MSFVLRATCTKRISSGRAFHTPFALLGTSPLSTPPSSATFASQYEKQYDHPPEPITSHTGYRTYVVSEPDASIRHYQIPAGAYPTFAPYTHFVTADEQSTKYGAEQLARTRA